MKTSSIMKFAALATLTLGLAGCSLFENNLDELPPKAGVFAENLNKKGDIQPQLTDRVQEGIDNFMENEQVNEVIDSAKNAVTKENAEKLIDKTKELSGSDKAQKVKDEVKNGFNSLWGGLTSKVDGFTSNDSPSVEYSSDDDSTRNSLAELNFNSGDTSVVEVNDNKSTLNAADWTESYIAYSNLDELNRTGTATAYLDKSNVGPSEGRGSQSWQPTGWKNQAKTIDGKKVYPFDRGHLIAYTLSFNLNDDGAYSAGESGSEDNPKNLVTQTSYSNRVVFQRYEGLVRDELKDGGQVIYRVQPVFRDNEKLARGFWLQAVSVDGDLDFNVYVFNVMDDLVFDYSDGSSTVDKTMEVN